MASQLEAIRDQSHELKKESATVNTVFFKNTVSKQGKPPCKRKDTKDKRAPETKRCTHRGGGYQSQDKCPAKEVTFYNSQKKGHYCNQCFHPTNPSRSDVADIQKDLNGIFLNVASTGDQVLTCWQTQLSTKESPLRLIWEQQQPSLVKKHSSPMAGSS
uniref:Uncharacterized protein n=1 Tax=Amphimedon queenslandica TaxID=400682 RepID=A0A1X7VW35_AMPQE